ncbi:MAG: HIT domain-containing protein [bacterium]|nr:HIT domain-containing protein [bacterium]
MNNECIFCKIVHGDIPSYKVYEDENFTAFLDIRPWSPGHTLVIPKEHHTWVWDVPQSDKYFALARRIALSQRAAFGTDFVIAKIFGEEVPHAHIQVYPNEGTKGDKMAFEENAAKIRNALDSINATV